MARIVKDYDLYVRRNLARGYSAKDLNVSFLSEKKFRLQNKMDELKDRGRRVMTEVKGDIITKWEEKSREFVDAFLLLFGRERLHHLWNESKGKLIQALSPPGSPSGSVNGDIDGDEYDDDEEEYELPGEVSIHMEQHSPRARRTYHRRVLESPTMVLGRSGAAAAALNSSTSSTNAEIGSTRLGASNSREEDDDDDDEYEEVEFERRSN